MEEEHIIRYHLINYQVERVDESLNGFSYSQQSGKF